MKVGFNAYLLSDPSIRGWTRYTLELIHSLKNEDVEIHLYSYRPLHQTHAEQLSGKNVHFHAGQSKSYGLWEQLELPRAISRDNIDLFHTPIHYGIPLSLRIPSVITLHDAIGISNYSITTLLKNFTNTSRLITLIREKTSINKAKAIITVSHFSAAELTSKLKIDKDKIHVIHEAAPDYFHYPSDDAKERGVLEKYRIKKPYFFYVGGYEERKNIPFLIKSFCQADVKGTSLVLGGKINPELQQALEQEAFNFRKHHVLNFINWVDDEDLPTLYRNSIAFVYPSLMEGFGLQLVEAMAAGVPILSSDVTSLPEVAGNAGLMFSPYDTSSLISALEQIVDIDHHSHYAKASIERSRMFSWKQTARRTLQVYESLVSKPPKS